MHYETQIDTITLQVEFEKPEQQREILHDLLNFIHQKRSLYIQYKSQVISVNSIRGIHTIFMNNTTVASINTSMFMRNINHNEQIQKVPRYYISIKFAGLKSYHPTQDMFAQEILLLFCSYFNTNGLIFTITELDICLDVECPLEQILAVCVKRAPKTKYYKLQDRQAYSTTKYLEKIPTERKLTIVRRAYYYDKSVKENLTTPLSRFELKLQAKYFRNHGCNIETIAQVLEAYSVMYFQNISQKEEIALLYDQQQESPRKRKKMLQEMSRYRLHFDLYYIDQFIRTLYTVRLNQFTYLSIS